MRPSRALWLLLLLVAASGAATFLTCPGCIDRARVNTRCEWHGGGPLVADAQLAEELAVRYADAEFARRSGFNAHGGLLEGGAVRDACMARLVEAIERDHGATADQAVGCAAVLPTKNPRSFSLRPCSCRSRRASSGFRSGSCG